ncbi:MAG: DNA-directed RNA polymerase subunit N [Cenarchaeum sp. SB0665_bin_23]|nr:DNA-directed RNA polymerase subunit N [Cenarchaeum sp. SB0667_bin_13]MXY37900.1 DNA-directed RNA polymerase subunit N [Cenarchaeum sp. SB0664_bin_35]MXY60525.1 DNA-directed RNA polymerase subunit N [Cenarchaeum sp. SB0665_bin_23]MXZ93998.1 DNA-directed RNA polymerase subunit N [Cenarchaeum sp. SB0666_bin_15]MYB46211.1 DNA-directed RNA polymerase subunit N [Cenarchaeum sp. SB0662_bin_33]MYC79104.1 DNA-directed RNA polymerase subunit N [Cenarchaeum sp. SB0661_bin_35]MYD58218.1 DNA-directed R
MLVPVRCFTCGNLIADKMDTYKKEIMTDKDSSEVLDDLKLSRYCCRRMLLTTVETIHQIIPFYEAVYKRNEETRRETI